MSAACGGPQATIRARSRTPNVWLGRTVTALGIPAAARGAHDRAREAGGGRWLGFPRD